MDPHAKRQRIASHATQTSTQQTPDLPATLWAVILFEHLSIQERAVLRRVDKSWPERLKRAAAVATTLTVQPKEWHYSMGDIPRHMQKLTLHVDYFTKRPPNAVMSRWTVRHLRIHCMNPKGFWPTSELNHVHKPWPRLESLHIHVGCGDKGIVDTPDKLTKHMPNLRELRLFGTKPGNGMSDDRDGHHWTAQLGMQWQLLRVLEMPLALKHGWGPLVKATPQLETLILHSDHGWQTAVDEACVDVWIQGWPRLRRFTWNVKGVVRVTLRDTTIERAMRWTTLDIRAREAWIGTSAELTAASEARNSTWMTAHSDWQDARPPDAPEDSAEYKAWFATFPRSDETHLYPVEFTSVGGLQRLPAVE